MQGRKHATTDHWYVIHCEAQHDRQVQRLLQERGVNVFAPRILRTRKRNGDKALFPGYVFVRLDLGTGVWGVMRYLPGIRKLVEVGGEACPVDETVIVAIRRRVEHWMLPVEQLKPGDRVAVTSGIFADLEGVFTEALSGDERVAILLDIMRRQVRVELATHEIRSAGSAA